MYLSQFARKVIILVRADALGKGMSQYLVDQIEQTPNIEVRLRSTVVEAHGDVALEAVSVGSSATGAVDRIPASGLFVFIGAMPRTEWLDGVVARDAHGFILTGSDLLLDGAARKRWKLDRDPLPLETSTPGLFAAGDVRHQSMKRIAPAVGEGAMAVALIHQYLRLM